MNNKQILLDKMHILLGAVNKAKQQVDESKVKYLDNYEHGIESVIQKLQVDELPASNGGLIGTMRGISEYDSLASIKELYDAAADVDLFYSNECEKWN